MWLKQLKSAVVMHDMQKVEELLREIPTELGVKECEEASFLLDEAAKISKQLRDETAMQMQKVRKNINFLHATASNKEQSLDITS